MYYLTLINEDSSEKEIEVQQGHIFCKCQVCGQKFAPHCIEFNKRFDSEEESFYWNACPDCIQKRCSELAKQEREAAHQKLADELSRFFKREITLADIEQFMDANKGVGYKNIMSVAQKHFGNGSCSVSEESRKPKIAQQEKSITILPRQEHR